MDNTAKNKAIVRRWFEEVWNKGQEATIDELFPSIGVAYGLGDTATEVRGPEQIKPFVRNLRSAIPDLRIDVDDIVAEGDRVVVRLTLKGTHSGGAMGVAASGHRVHISGLVLVRVSGDQIVEGWNNWDQLSFLRQIGALPAAANDRFLTAST